MESNNKWKRLAIASIVFMIIFFLLFLILLYRDKLWEEAYNKDMEFYEELLEDYKNLNNDWCKEYNNLLDLSNIQLSFLKSYDYDFWVEQEDFEIINCEVKK